MTFDAHRVDRLERRLLVAGSARECRNGGRRGVNEPPHARFAHRLQEFSVLIRCSGSKRGFRTDSPPGSKREVHDCRGPEVPERLRNGVRSRGPRGIGGRERIAIRGGGKVVVYEEVMTSFPRALTTWLPMYPAPRDENPHEYSC